MSEASILTLLKLVIDSVVAPILLALTALFSAAVLRRVNQNTTSLEKTKAAVVDIETAVKDTKLELVDNTRKTETVVAQNEVIHKLVNSASDRNENELKQVQADFKQVQAEFKEFVAAELQKARDEIAQLRSVVVTNGSASTPNVPVNTLEGASPAASLTRIDRHTEQIEKNTASTEAKISDLKSEDHR